MKVVIKQIAVFNNTGGKRHVPFNDGLNIITGDSKTGKSALIEIVDYCLFSSRSSIPKGKITDFSELFVVIFQVDKIFIVIGRPAPETGNMKEAYLNVEMEYSNVEDIQIDYFEKLFLKPIKDDVQTEFEEYLGLSFRQLEVEGRRPSKLSIRDTVSFLFQHQNLIANKHALFYRFDDVEKRKRVIEALPVLLGLADPEYYELIKEKGVVEREINAENKLLKKLQTRKEDETSTLKELIQIYYSQIGQTIPSDITLLELRKLGLELPEPPELLIDQTKLYTELSDLEKERELIYLEKEEIEKSLANLYSYKDEGYNYAKQLVATHAKQKYSDENLVEVHCPLCDSQLEELNENIGRLKDSKEKLVGELSKLAGFSKDSTKIISELNGKKRTLEAKIKKLSRNINLLVANSQEGQKNKTKREQLIRQKGAIEATIKNFMELNSIGVDRTEMQKLQEDLQEINRKLKKYSGLESFQFDTEGALKRAWIELLISWILKKNLNLLISFSILKTLVSNINTMEILGWMKWEAAPIGWLVTFLSFFRFCI